MAGYSMVPYIFIYPRDTIYIIRFKKLILSRPRVVIFTLTLPLFLELFKEAYSFLIKQFSTIVYLKRN
jgi:hypothetical protein